MLIIPFVPFDSFSKEIEKRDTELRWRGIHIFYDTFYTKYETMGMGLKLICLPHPHLFIFISSVEKHCPNVWNLREDGRASGGLGQKL